MSTAYSCTVEPDFCAVMPDDSMTGAGIYCGDLVCFVACDHVASGKIAAVRVGESVIVRRVEATGDRTALVPASPAYSATIIESPADKVEILGRLVESRHSYAD